MTVCPVSRTSAIDALRRMAAWPLVAGLMLFAFASILPTANASPAPPADRDAFAGQETAFPERRADLEIRVYDTMDILTPDEEESLHNELKRARTQGIEYLIYTRISTDSPEQSQEFADRLRTEWGVESAEGADDGIVLLVSVNLKDRETNGIYVSAGQNTFPIRQLTSDGMQRILQEEMQPRIVEGKFSEAIQFGVRRVLNYAEYTPPEPPPATSLQQRLGTVAQVGAAALLLLAVVGYFVFPVIRSRRLGFSPDRSSLTLYAVTLAVLGIVVGAIAIVARSEFGSLASLAVVTWCLVAVPLLAGRITPDEGERERVTGPQDLAVAVPKHG